MMKKIVAIALALLLVVGASAFAATVPGLLSNNSGVLPSNDGFLPDNPVHADPFILAVRQLVENPDHDAGDPTSEEFIPGNTMLEPGDQFYVALYIDANPGYSQFAVTLEFDGAKLSLDRDNIDASRLPAGVVLRDTLTPGDELYESWQYRFGLFLDDGTTDYTEGRMLMLPFTVHATLTPADYGLTPLTFLDEGYHPFDGAYVNTSIPMEEWGIIDNYVLNSTEVLIGRLADFNVFFHSYTEYSRPGMTTDVVFHSYHTDVMPVLGDPLIASAWPANNPALQPWQENTDTFWGTIGYAGWHFAGWNAVVDGELVPFNTTTPLTAGMLDADGNLNLYADLTDFLFGDMDGDGTVTHTDFLLLRLYLDSSGTHADNIHLFTTGMDSPSTAEYEDFATMLLDYVARRPGTLGPMATATP